MDKRKLELTHTIDGLLTDEDLASRPKLRP